jgi:diaminopimelate epimerase
MGTPFIKMHGLGNDFVVVDARARALALSNAAAHAIADRKTGVGCDQIITVRASKAADAFMRIQNADGGEVEACGNAARCVADLLMRETGKPTATIETVAGVLEARRAAGGRVAVDMGPARLDWREIPLSHACDTLRVPMAIAGFAEPTAVNIGNPHAVFFVPDAEAVPLAEIGPDIEHHAFFPQRTNVEFVQVLDRKRLRMRVWERGVGITRACGSGACAAAVAAARRGLSDRACEVRLDGGPLFLEWREDGHVIMTGPVATSFAGELDGSLLPSAGAAA